MCSGIYIAANEYSDFETTFDVGQTPYINNPHFRHAGPKGNTKPFPSISTDFFEDDGLLVRSFLGRLQRDPPQQTDADEKHAQSTQKHTDAAKICHPILLWIVPQLSCPCDHLPDHMIDHFVQVHLTHVKRRSASFGTLHSVAAERSHTGSKRIFDTAWSR